MNEALKWLTVTVIGFLILNYSYSRKNDSEIQSQVCKTSLCFLVFDWDFSGVFAPGKEGRKEEEGRKEGRRKKQKRKYIYI